MKLKEKILYSKKFITFLFMILFYTVSYSSPSENNIIDVSEKVKQTFISELTAHNPAAYYISPGRNSTVEVYQEKHEENQCIVVKVKEWFGEEKYYKTKEIFVEEVFLSAYEIATDINRSLRN